MTRTRTRYNTDALPTTTTGASTVNNPGAKTCDTGAPVQTLPWVYSVGETQTMTDVVVRDYARRSAAGEIFNNPMTSVKTTRECSLSSMAYNTPYQSGYPAKDKYCGQFYTATIPQCLNGLVAAGGPTGHLSVDINVQNLINVASTAAAANIDAPTFGSAVALAELRETLSYLRNPLAAFNRVAEDARHWKRRKRKFDRKTTAEYIADNWLSYRYAVRPLVKDVRDLAEAVARTVLDAEPERNTARGSASSSGTNSASGSLNSLFDYTTTTNTTVQVRAGVLYELLRDPNTFGVGTEQIPIALWEAIPLSFLVDWGLNIGSFIQAITPVGGTRKLASWTTVKTISSTTREIWWQNPGTQNAPTNPVTRVITSDGRSIEKYTSETTVRTPGIQIGLGYKTYPFRGDVGQLRILDLLALGRQILLSK